MGQLFHLFKRLGSVKALILDMDGVLVDTEPLHMEAFRRYLKRYRLPHDDAFIFGFIGISVPDNMRLVYRNFFHSDDEHKIAQAIKERDAIYLQLLRETPLKPLPGIEALIEFCERRKRPVALASSSDREQVTTIFENLKKTSNGRFDPDKIFKIVLSGEDVRHRKPHPEIYRKAVRLLGVEPHQALAIEDSPAGVQSAKSAGLLCMALKSRFVAQEKLNEADVKLDSLFDALHYCKQAM